MVGVNVGRGVLVIVGVKVSVGRKTSAGVLVIVAVGNIGVTGFESGVITMAVAGEGIIEAVFLIAFPMEVAVKTGPPVKDRTISPTSTG